ncbi:MAG TPA: alpha/beta hydrolase [Actinocrinis sp.]|nr:alpha/beta hydrolase [Actinocrinis sp.]
MPRAKADGVELEYDSFGDPADPPLLLIMGLATQMIGWPEGFCELLAGRGFHVTRFDNRDIGLSTQLDGVPKPDLMAIMGGDPATAPYLLEDMARDVVALLDTLDAARAHVVGISMGGMIAQELAIRHPERVLSLCSIMSTTGDRSVGQPSQEALTAILLPPGTDRESAIERGVTVLKVISSPGYPPTEQWMRDKTAAAYDRAFHPEGGARQFAAIVASPDRTEGLRALTLPTVVIHGEDDRLVDVSGGKATAAAVPDAELVLLPGLGHDLPEALWPVFADAIARNAARAA